MCGYYAWVRIKLAPTIDPTLITTFMEIKVWQMLKINNKISVALFCSIKGWLMVGLQKLQFKILNTWRLKLAIFNIKYLWKG